MLPLSFSPISIDRRISQVAEWIFGLRKGFYRKLQFLDSDQRLAQMPRCTRTQCKPESIPHPIAEGNGGPGFSGD